MSQSDGPPFMVIRHALLRAPLLPASALLDPGRALDEHPLGRAAVALASAELDAALTRTSAASGERPAELAAATAARLRYGRRAAFRPTPTGLLAGVAAAILGDETAIHLGTAKASVTPAWGRLWALGRALLDEPAVRRGVRLRLAPSVLRSGESLVWLALELDGLEEQAASLDETLALVLAATGRWSPWTSVRRRLRAQLGGDAEDLDNFLLELVDRGLLTHDLLPPLVGEPPSQWMQRRLRTLSVPVALEVAAALEHAESLATAGDVSAARRLLGELPGVAPAASAPDLHGMLTLQSEGGVAVLDERAVERAAALAPLLFRLQQAIAGPVAERQLDQPLLARLQGIAEVFGAGAYQPAALATGGHGVALTDGHEPEVRPAAWPAPLLAYLTEALMSAARSGAGEILLDGAKLESVLPWAPPPSTFELCLTPARSLGEPAPGTGWMVALHGPAGASFGRFAAARGAPAATALEELARRESEARPAARVVDVVAAPSAALADLAAHPPLREAALALTGWPDGEAITPADLGLVIDEALPGGLGLRAAGQGATAEVLPAPLSRVRSTTVPPGLYRLLAGWSLSRQHAPWMFSWGALGGLPFLPRVVLDGFVIAPASWRIPPAEALGSEEDVQSWRLSAGLPRQVQVGQGDELLYLDLAAPGARGDLLRAADGRAFEIWPPLDRLVDAGGRRVEAVVAVVTAPLPEELATSALVASAGPVPPPLPGSAAPAPGWRTFRLYGPEEGQDAILHEAVSRVLRPRPPGRWFFIRYREAGTSRPHLRLRVRLRRTADGVRFAARLAQYLSPLRAAGLLSTLEQAEYFPETARYGGSESMEAAELIFQAGSELVLETLALEDQGALAPESNRRLLFVRAADGLARGLGLDLGQRHALAVRRRAAHARAAGEGEGGAVLVAGMDVGEDPTWLGERRTELRGTGRELEPLLAGRMRDAATPALARFESAVRSAVKRLPGPASTALRGALSALLHTQAVRMLGPHADEERAGYFFWERALASSVARAREGRSIPKTKTKATAKHRRET